MSESIFHTTKVFEVVVIVGHAGPSLIIETTINEADLSSLALYYWRFNMVAIGNEVHVCSCIAFDMIATVYVSFLVVRRDVARDQPVVFWDGYAIPGSHSL